MIKMNEEKLIEILKDNIPDDYIRGCDTADGIGKYITDKDSWQYQLYVYVSKLQNNWNELKKWLEDEVKNLDKENPMGHDTTLTAYEGAYDNALDKMQELEGNNE